MPEGRIEKLERKVSANGGAYTVVSLEGDRRASTACCARPSRGPARRPVRRALDIRKGEAYHPPGR